MDRHDGNLLRDPAGESPDRTRLAPIRNRVLRKSGGDPGCEAYTESVQAA